MKRKRKNAKPRIVVKGPLAGFFIIDPMWDADYCDSLLLSLSETITSASEPEEDTNFIIEET